MFIFYETALGKYEHYIMSSMLLFFYLKGHQISSRAAKVDCLQRLMYFYAPDRNLSQAATDYFSSIAGSSLRFLMPRTGFRKRKEYRVLTDTERTRLHQAFNKLYNVRFKLA